MVINNEREPFFFFKGSSSGLLCKVLPLFGLDKTLKFDENSMNLGAYENGESLASIMLAIHV